MSIIEIVYYLLTIDLMTQEAMKWILRIKMRQITKRLSG